MMLTSSDIAVMTEGKLVGRPDLPVNDIITDSRLSNYSPGLVFVAISGTNHDGHDFIDQMYSKGVRVFVTEREPSLKAAYPGSAFIVAGNSIDALQKMAAYKRRTFDSTVIAVTGSSGKTIVKEWLAGIIGSTVPVLRSPKSYNSQVGVPLSVWKLDNKYKFGIFEAGISKPGEMARLQKIINPVIGIITNIGDAHRENFPDDSVKAREKLLLFRDSDVIVYCRDYEVIRQEIMGNNVFGGKRLIDWSWKDRNAAGFVSRGKGEGGGTRLLINFEGKRNAFEIPFTDKASVENAVTVAFSCLAIGTAPDIIGSGMRKLVPVAMRMEMKGGINDCQLIEDYYNSDPGSLSMALEYLKSQTGKRSTLILSDFVQSGRDEQELYGDVAELIRHAGVKRFIGIGNALMRNRKLFGEDAVIFGSTEDFVRSFNGSEFKNEIILLKGARVYEFERIGNLLEHKIHQTELQINLDAISHNLSEIRKHLNPGTQMMAMVKAFAYGAGPAEIASLLEYHKVSYLAVAYPDEGADLRNAGVTLPVMVMNPDPAASDLMIKYNLEPELFSFESFDSFVSAAFRNGLINYPVHLKIDTGMHRLGFLPGDIDRLAEKISSTDRIRIVSVFSHLAASEDPGLDHFSRKQAEIFLTAAGRIKEATGYPLIRHLLNTAGIARMPEYQFEMVRPGIGIYGVGRPAGLSLKPAGRFVTRVSQVKHVGAGEPVGYGCTDISDTDRTIAILPAGYADGLNRRLGNRTGEILINGRKVPVIGNICMDMCMVDVSGMVVKTGDEAEIFGSGIRIEEVADKCGTIPYEILTSIPPRVKRVFFRE